MVFYPRAALPAPLSLGEPAPTLVALAAGPAILYDLQTWHNIEKRSEKVYEIPVVLKTKSVHNTGKMFPISQLTIYHSVIFI